MQLPKRVNEGIWWDVAWNPTTGCSPVSAGCKHCWASAMAKRFWDGKEFSDVQFHWELLDRPLRWKKPRRIFLCSMGDLFHEKIQFQQIKNVWDTIFDTSFEGGRYSKHTYFILTKRPERVLEFDAYMSTVFHRNIIYNNLHIGISAEDQKTADERIWALRFISAAKKFISLEPLLSPVKDLVLTGIDWVIVGGESGPKARPMHPDWVRSVRDQCLEANVPFFFKQWGEFISSYDAGYRSGEKDQWKRTFGEAWVKCKKYRFDDGKEMVRVGKKKAGRLLDGREWNEFPE
jgi:protein gp37